MPLTAGIDLGTTNSCIAIYRNGTIQIIETEEGMNTLPSFVFYDENNKTFVGAKAVKRSALNRKNGIYDVKRFIGCKFNDENLQINSNMWPFNVVEGKNGECEIVMSDANGKEKRIHPEEVSADVLRTLKKNVEKALSEKVDNVVITVPAYFTNSQRQATKDAAYIAGLNVLKLINEPTAAALAFTHYQNTMKRRTVLVYDLGGGTFDVTLMKSDAKGKIDVQAVSGESHLGGRDFDKNLLLYLLDQIEKKYEVPPEGLKKRRLIRRLEQECENIKIALSENLSADLELYEFTQLENVNITVTREIFERINKELFEQTIEVMDGMLNEIKFNKKNIDEVLLVGGSTRIPKIRQMVKDYFNGKEPNRTVNPDEVVAIGAALQAALLSEAPSQLSKSYIVNDVVSHSLGIEVAAENTMSVIIKKNSKIPCVVQKIYYTSVDFQVSSTISVYEGESNLVKENTLLGQFIIDGITPRQRAQVQFTITFQLDSDGILKVTATENSKNITKNLSIALVNARMTEEDKLHLYSKAISNRDDGDDD